MQFSTFKKNLNDRHGVSLILGVVEEDIESQLGIIKFVVDPKLLLKKNFPKKIQRRKRKKFKF